MVDNNNYEREIDLVQMIKYLWKRVAYMLIGAVIGFLVFLCLAYVLGAWKNVSKEGEMSAYQKELKEYQEDYDQLKMEVSTLEKSIEEQVNYNSESILMKINPYDEKSVSGQFFIDTDYKINPELTYQNTDLTTSVARAYEALASTGTLANYINEQLETPIKEKYLNELIKVEYLQDATLQVSVKHTSMEEAREIYGCVIECMEEHKAEFQKTVGNYTITLINESDKAGVDTELKDTQTANLEAINTLKETLNGKKNALKALVKPATGGMNYKLPVLGGLLGGFLVLGVYVVLFLMDDTLKTEQDIVHLLQFPILGSIPVEEDKVKQVKKTKYNRKSRYTQYRSQSK